MNLAGVAAGLALLGAAFAMLGTGPPVEPFAPQPCTRAVLVDDLLHCDGIEAAALGGGCPPEARPRWVDAPVPGDRIDRARLCGEAVVHRLDAARGWTRMESADLAALSLPIDVNTASVQELQSLRGIGPALAARIVAARPFATVDDLQRVSGIGPKTLARVRGRIRVGARSRGSGQGSPLRPGGLPAARPTLE